MQFARSTHATFEATFLDEDNQPLVAADPVSYPAVAIKDMHGTTISTGVGRPFGKGKYRYQWFVPADAELNPIDQSWSISWFFVTDAGYNRDYGENFSVVDKVDPVPEERKWTYLLRSGTTERLFLTLASQPYSIGLDILDASDKIIASTEGVANNVAQATCATAISNRKIGRITKDGRYQYFFDTDPLNQGEYLIFWRIRETEVSPQDQVQQLLRVPEMKFWRLNQPLRMLIDKLQKKIGWVQAYSDSDIYEYLIRGVDMANQVAPATDWTFSSIPISGSRGVIDAVLIFAAIWGLNAQDIMETELRFDHGAQTVTLNYQHDYSGVIGRLNELLNRFAESKLLLYRLANGPGRVGVRPKNWRFNQRVWRVDNWGSGSPYDVSTLLTSAGL